MNCGPRRRFVVASRDGTPLIVHNCENIIQAISRDVLYSNMGPIEKAGYKIRLTVHDEVITTAPDLPQYNVDELSHLLATVPSWAPGLPLAAAGFETYRYRKD